MFTYADAAFFFFFFFFIAIRRYAAFSLPRHFSLFIDVFSFHFLLYFAAYAAMIRFAAFTICPLLAAAPCHAYAAAMSFFHFAA